MLLRVGREGPGGWGERLGSSVSTYSVRRRSADNAACDSPAIALRTCASEDKSLIQREAARARKSRKRKKKTIRVTYDLREEIQSLSLFPSWAAGEFYPRHTKPKAPGVSEGTGLKGAGRGAACSSSSPLCRWLSPERRKADTSLNPRSAGWIEPSGF